MTAAALFFLGISLIIAAFIFTSVRIYQQKPDFMFKVLKYATLLGFIIISSIISALIGFRLDSRHEQTYHKNLRSVQEIWGGAITQKPPVFSYSAKVREEFEEPKTGRLAYRFRDQQIAMNFLSQKLRLKILKNIRQKGLLQYAGYDLYFVGEYEISNSLKESRLFSFTFPLPENAGNVTDIQVLLNDKPFMDDSSYADNIDFEGVLRPGEKNTFTISYKAQGTGSFIYNMNKQLQIKKFSVQMDTDFTDYLIPDRAMAPHKINEDQNLTRLTFEASDIITGQNIALVFQIPGNYGAYTSKLFFYAPIALFLFMGFLLLFSLSKKMELHLMHHLFLLTGFFIFYLLSSYLFSYLHFIPAILVSLGVSSGIVLYYAFLLKKDKTLPKIVTGGLLLFQWLFSFAFFIPEHTGLFITIAAIGAFVALLKGSAQVDWKGKW